MWNIPFTAFIKEMLPFELILLVVLLIFASIIFSAKQIEYKNFKDNESNKLLFLVSLIMLILYVLSIELRCAQWMLISVLMIYFICYRKVLLDVDWFLLLLFTITFIDFHLVSTLLRYLSYYLF